MDRRKKGFPLLATHWTRLNVGINKLTEEVQAKVVYIDQKVVDRSLVDPNMNMEAVTLVLMIPCPEC